MGLLVSLSHRRRKRRPLNQNLKQHLQKMRVPPRRRRRRRRLPSKAFIHSNTPATTRIPQYHLSPRGGRVSLLVSTKKIHFQKNHRSNPERGAIFFVTIRLSVFPLPSVWTSG